MSENEHVAKMARPRMASGALFFQGGGPGLELGAVDDQADDQDDGADAGLHGGRDALGDVAGRAPHARSGVEGTVVECAIGVHAASRFAWKYDFKVPDSTRDGKAAQ